MSKYRLYCAGLCTVALLLITASAMHAAPQAANFTGTWQMTMEAGGGGGGNGGGGGQGGGGGAQSLTIAQDGGKYKVTHKTARGENTVDATVSGNSISWTEMRQGRDGNTMTIEYKATVDGDTMTGTMGGGPASRQFTAKRGS